MAFLKGQFIKIRSTSILPLIIGIPLFFVTIFAVFTFLGNQGEFEVYSVAVLQMYFQLGLPLTITLVVGLMFRMERKNHAFQNTLIYFDSLKNYYIKQWLFYVIISWVMTLIAFFLLCIYYLVFFQGVEFFSVTFLYKFILSLITSIPIVTFVYMLNYVFESFVLSAMISFLLCIGNLFISLTDNIISHLYFYSFPTFIMYKGYQIEVIILMSIIYTLIFAIAGYLRLIKRIEKGQL